MRESRREERKKTALKSEVGSVIILAFFYDAQINVRLGERTGHYGIQSRVRVLFLLHRLHLFFFRTEVSSV